MVELPGAGGAGPAGTARVGVVSGAGVLLAVGAGVGAAGGPVGDGGQISTGRRPPMVPHGSATAGAARTSGVSARVRAAAAAYPVLLFILIRTIVGGNSRLSWDFAG
ncbi:hypothetical protein ACQCSU_14930 [Pseudarthrobacter sp. O4]|uniref:hypothetical protein n=1 Tax=Pseudarthrobacter sp. O4 TaxID=3418417 RepID=UPI003CF6A184